MELKPGYKRTEAGLVPADWIDCTVGDLIAFEGGSQPDKSHFKQSWNPGYTRLIQIRDYKSSKYETYVPSKLVRRFCDENDIMIGRYGPPVFQILKGISGAYNVALIKAKPTSQINKKYAYYFLKQDSLFTFVDKLSQRSSGQTGVDLKELRAYPLPLPPTKVEQEAIANALSDADALIESLDQLIAKKRQIKQGAMQELLTGKRRLPGFSWEWEVKRLGDIAEIVMGQSPSSAHYNRSGAGLPLIQGNADIENRKTIKRVFTTHVSKYGRCGDVLLSVRAPVGEVSIAVFDVCLGRGVCAVRYSNSFLYHALIAKEPVWAKLSKGSTFDSVNSADVRSFEIAMPHEVAEQTAIATVLSDMDTELAALESRLAKARQIKQGMMQELLTGRIRLL